MKKLSLVSISALLCLSACGDRTSTENAPAPKGKNEIAKDSLSQYLSTARLMSMTDTVAEVDAVIETDFTWMDAMSACPNGYRLPTVDEFKKLSARKAEFTKGDIWWTANVTDSQDSSADASAMMATFPEGGLAFQFKKANVSALAKVKCIEDTTGNKLVVNELAQKSSEMSGIVDHVKLTPYYETSLNNMGCTDCCCEEGNGGILDVSILKEDGTQGIFQIRELSDSFCGALSFNEDNTPKDIQKEADGCTPASMENFRILDLFLPGVKVKREGCESAVYLMTPAGNAKKSATCGETITLEFSGKVQDVSLAVNADPEAEKECNYSILLTGSEKPIATKGTCSNAEIGMDYKIQVTLTLDAVTGRDTSPILQQEYPCCYGEIQSHQVANISFEQIPVLAQPAAQPTAQPSAQPTALVQASAPAESPKN